MTSANSAGVSEMAMMPSPIRAARSIWACLAGAMVGCQQPGDAAAAVEMLRGGREHGHGIQSEMPPVMAVGLAGSQALADFDHFLEPAGAAGGVDPGGGPFAPLLGVERPPNPGADNQTAAGNQVNRGHSLGHQDGMAQGGQQHRSAKTHAAGAGGQGAQSRQRLQAGLGDQTVADPYRIPVRRLPPVPPYGKRGRRWAAVRPATVFPGWAAAGPALGLFALIYSPARKFFLA